MSTHTAPLPEATAALNQLSNFACDLMEKHPSMSRAAAWNRALRENRRLAKRAGRSPEGPEPDEPDEPEDEPDELPEPDDELPPDDEPDDDDGEDDGDDDDDDQEKKRKESKRMRRTNVEVTIEERVAAHQRQHGCSHAEAYAAVLLSDPQMYAGYLTQRAVAGREFARELRGDRLSRFKATARART